VIKSLLMNDVHEHGDAPLTAQVSEELLSEAMDIEGVEEAIDGYVQSQRRVVFHDSYITVLDSHVGDLWQRCAFMLCNRKSTKRKHTACNHNDKCPCAAQDHVNTHIAAPHAVSSLWCSMRTTDAVSDCRDVVLASQPTHTQTCMLLEPAQGEGENGVAAPGKLRVNHARLPDSTPVFQLLAAAVPLLSCLHKSQQETRRGAREASYSPEQCTLQRVRVAVIGAGACAVPAVLHRLHSNVLIDAVDIDKRASLPLVLLCTHAALSHAR
jgi:hypothetical protein